LEYRTAIDCGKDILIFMLDEDAPWPRRHVERGPGAERIEALRSELLEKHLCSFFSAKNELAAIVTAAVARWASGQARVLAVHGRLSAEMLARYYQRMQQQYGRLELDTLTPPQDEELLRIQLRSVFVEPSVRVDPPPVELPKEWWERLQIEGEIGADDLPEGVGHEDLRRVRELWRAKPPRRVLEVLTDPAEQHVVLLGDPGAGKSTLARYLALSLAAPGVDGQLSNLEGYLPLLIELRDFAALLAKGKCETFLGAC
jgi:hypothetical protein